MVHGSLVRDGERVRLDLALVGTDSAAAPLARATVSAPPDSVAALTDSAARALVAQIWSRGTPPTPSLDAALRTRSVPALREFLQGERQLALGEWDTAAVSYERAIRADPRFWLAYARHIYARYWSTRPVADSVVDTLDRHRFELPERDRLSTEAITLLARDSLARVLEVGEAAGERYPSSWFAWLIYGDALLHAGPLVGHTRDEASRAFTAAAARALGSLERLDAGPTLTADGYGNRMLQFRFLRAIQRGDSAAVDVLTDSIARDVASPAVADASCYDPYAFAFFPQQIAVSRAVIAQLPSARRGEQGLMLALSWGGRGAWDSVVAGMDRMGGEGGDSLAALRAYGRWRRPSRHHARAPPVPPSSPGWMESWRLPGTTGAGSPPRRARCSGLGIPPRRRSAARSTHSRPRSRGTFAERGRPWRPWSGSRPPSPRPPSTVILWSLRSTGWPRPAGWPPPGIPSRRCGCCGGWTALSCSTRARCTA